MAIEGEGGRECRSSAGTDLKKFEIMGNHMTGLATASRGATEIAVWRGITDPGAGTPPHTHDHEEVLVVLAGSATLTIDGQELSLGPGDTAIAPARVRHRFVNTGSGPLDVLAAMPLGTRTFLPDGEELHAPWGE